MDKPISFIYDCCLSISIAALIMAVYGAIMVSQWYAVFCGQISMAASMIAIATKPYHWGNLN